MMNGRIKTCIMDAKNIDGEFLLTLWLSHRVIYSCSSILSTINIILFFVVIVDILHHLEFFILAFHLFKTKWIHSNKNYFKKCCKVTWSQLNQFETWAWLGQALKFFFIEAHKNHRTAKQEQTNLVRKACIGRFYTISNRINNWMILRFL